MPPSPRGLRTAHPAPHRLPYLILGPYHPHPAQSSTWACPLRGQRRQRSKDEAPDVTQHNHHKSKLPLPLVTYSCPDNVAPGTQYTSMDYMSQPSIQPSVMMMVKTNIGWRQQQQSGWSAGCTANNMPHTWGVWHTHESCASCPHRAPHSRNTVVPPSSKHLQRCTLDLRERHYGRRHHKRGIVAAGLYSGHCVAGLYLGCRLLLL